MPFLPVTDGRKADIDGVEVGPRYGGVKVYVTDYAQTTPATVAPDAPPPGDPILRFKVGDRVRYVGLGRAQEDKGVVTGYTKELSGWLATVKWDAGSICSSAGGWTSIEHIPEPAPSEPQKKVPVVRGGMCDTHEGRAEGWKDGRCYSWASYTPTATYNTWDAYRSTYARGGIDHIRVPEDFKGELPDWCEWACCLNCKYCGARGPEAPCNKHGGYHIDCWRPKE